MDIKKYERMADVSHLSGYEPLEVHYMKYYLEDPAMLATGHKISDAYQCLCRAYSMLYYSCAKDWGDIAANDTISKLFARSQMVFSALLQYAACYDICWQIVWANLTPTSLEVLISGEYREMQDECKKESIDALLSDTQKIPGRASAVAQDVKQLLNMFDTDADVKRVRDLNNYYKHKGVIHIEGLGMNEERTGFVVEGVTIPSLYRESISIEALEDLLFNYHNKIVVLINALITHALPSDYLNCSMPASEFIKSLVCIGDRIENPIIDPRNPS